MVHGDAKENEKAQKKQRTDHPLPDHYILKRYLTKLKRNKNSCALWPPSKLLTGAL